MCGCVRILSGVSRLRLTSCQHLQLERSQGGHCCSNSRQPSPWQRALQQRLPQQLWSRSLEGEVGVRKSGPQHRGPSPKRWPQGLSVCPGPSIWFACSCVRFLSACVSLRQPDYVECVSVCMSVHLGLCFSLFVCTCQLSVCVYLHELWERCIWTKVVGFIFPGSCV